MSEKTCRLCGITKAISEFYREKNRVDGLRPECKACVRQRQREYAAANPEAIRARGLAYVAANREAVRANGRAWRARHIEAERARLREWGRAHPEHVQIHSANRIGRRYGVPGKVTLAEWKRILLFYGHACARCGVSGSEEIVTLDHFIPTSKGGENTWRNIWPLCLSCNLKKATTIPSESHPPHVAVFSRTGTDD